VIVACIIVRAKSKRLPLKPFRLLDEKKSISILDYMLANFSILKSVDKVVICTSWLAQDDIFEDYAKKHGVEIYRGDPNNPLERMLSVSERYKADFLVRVTGDNPFTDGDIVGRLVDFMRRDELDYSRALRLPLGVTPEVFSASLIRKLSKVKQIESEYLYIYAFNPDLYKCGILLPENDISQYSLTVDTYQDLLRAKAFYSDLRTSGVNSLVAMANFFSGHEKIFKDNVLIKMPSSKTISYSDFIFWQNDQLSKSRILLMH